MSFIHRWRVVSYALGLVALAFASAVRAADVTVAFGALSTSAHAGNAMPSVTATVPVVVYIGCLSTTTSVSIHDPYGGQSSLPTATNGYYRITSGVVVSPSISVTSDSAPPKDFSTDQTFYFTLYRGSSTILDTESFTVHVSGTMVYNAGAPNANTPDTATGKTIYLSLKENGVATGKTRLPYLGSQVATGTPDKLNVITNVPAWATNASGQVYNPTPPTYTIGSLTGSFGTGTNWMQVSVDQGSVTGVPSWLSTAFPGAVSFTSGGSTYLVGAFGRSFTGGGGNVLTDASGNIDLSTWGSGYGNELDLQFPVSFKPTAVDASTPSNPPNISNLDPCFLTAATDLGLTNTPVSGTPTPPAGTLAGNPVSLPTLPGTPTGGGTSVTGPGAGGATGGGVVSGPSGVGGNPATGNSGFVAGSGGGTGGSGTEAASGTYTYQSPGTLPADGADAKDVQDTVTAYNASVTSVQSAAQGAASWATIQPLSVGMASDWNVNFNLMGQTYLVAMPVGSAPTIRGLILLLVQVTFVVAVYRTIMSL